MIRGFLRAHFRFLAFGFLTAFFSSFGQTFFIALSGPGIREAFSLSHGDFGLIYAVGTLSSAVLLIWAGRKIDDLDLRHYTGLVVAGLGFACLGLSVASSALWLIPAIFALRFTGQGLMSHISLVSMARYFDKQRGRALSIAAMGFPVGEAIFPAIGVAIIAAVGWRDMWQGAGIAVLVLLVPFLLWLLKGQRQRDQQFAPTPGDAATEDAETGWSRRQVVRDPRFYVLLPSYLAMSFIVTGFFFHQVHLTEDKNWSLAVFAGYYVVYASAQVAAALVTGGLIDRLSAATLMKGYLLPAGLGLVLLATTDAIWMGALFMVLLGISSGAVNVVHGAVWAEIYGVRHLGAIKALGTSLMVFSTALSPPLMGLAIDAGISMDRVAICCAAYVAAAAALVIWYDRRFGLAKNTGG